MGIPDNYEMWERHERKMELRIRKRPVCCECGERIQDEYAYHKDRLWYHMACMAEYLEPVEEMG